MLKNKIWIVALFAALAIGFIGCTDAAFDWEPPTEQLDDNALQILPKQTWAGFDLNHGKFNFAVGDVIEVTGKSLATNNMHISYNHQGRNPIGTTGEQRCNPDDEFELKGTLTKDHVDTIAGISPPAIRIYGNTAGATFIIYNVIVTRDGGEIFNLYEMILKDLKPGTTDINTIFDTEGIGDNPAGDLEDKTKHWISPAADAGKEAVFTILGPGFGGAAAADADPEYAGGDLTEKGNNIKYYDNGTPGTTPALTADDYVIDHDPHVNGVGVAISATGLVTFNVAANDGGTLRYKFPTSYYTDTDKSKIRWTPNALDLETDFDLIEINYTVSGVSGLTKGSTFKTKIVQYEGGWDGDAYTNIEDGNWVDLGGDGTRTLTVQTWGAGGKGGIEIHPNGYDIRGRVNFKINSVTFTKGTRVKVQFLTPQTPGVNNIAAITLLSGNSLDKKLPAPKNPGWTFMGWYDQWDITSQNLFTNAGVAPSGIGTQVDGDTAISADTTLYATWHKTGPQLSADNSPSFTTDDTAALPTVTYDSNSDWFLMVNATDNAVWTLQDASTTDLSTANAAITSGVGGSKVVYYTLAGATTVPFGVSAYKTIKVTYDLVLLTGRTGGIVQRVGTTEGSGDVGGYGLALEAGTGKTFEADVADFKDTWGFQAGYGGHGFIVRFTKVELIP